MSVVHHARAVGRNEMLFGGDTDVVPSTILLDRAPSTPPPPPHPGKGDVVTAEPWLVAMPSIAELLWPLLLLL